MRPKFVETYSGKEVQKIKSEFVRLQGIHYLDHAGSALYSEHQIKDSFGRLQNNLYCNPHTNEITERQVDEVRQKVLQFFNTNDTEYEVVFTKGATEGLKILAETFDFQSNGHFVYLRNAHNSVVGMRAIVNTKNISVMEVDPFLEIPSYSENNNSSIYSLSNSLMVYPAQCNFNGFKYPLSAIEKFHEGELPIELQQKSKNWFVCLDAANYASTSYLDLNKYRPDFVVMSFYKIFGYPTGLGALLVSRRGQPVLKKVYHGGGTVDFVLSNIDFHRKRSNFHERFEDGTLPFLSIISLLSGFATLDRLIPYSNGLRSMERVSFHVFQLGKYLYEQLERLKYRNGQPLIVFYNQTRFEEKESQGGIVTFNILRSNGRIVGYKEVEALAEMNDIYLRVGCFCNPGACQQNLKFSNNEVLKMDRSGHSCNGVKDTIYDRPLGFVRISIGYCTQQSNVDAFLRIVREYFLGILPIVKPPPSHKLDLIQIRIYPIKNAAPLIISSKWPIANNQFKYEGEWSIVNTYGAELNAKTCPNIQRLRVMINERKNLLRLIYPMKTDLDLSLNTPTQAKRENMKSNGMFDNGSIASEWLSDALQIPNAQIISRSSANGLIMYSYSPKTTSSIRVINAETILNYLTDAGVQEIQIALEEFVEIFRPNLLFYGGGDFSEKSKFHVGDSVFKVSRSSKNI